MDDLYARLKPLAPALADADRAALRRSLFGGAETVRLAPVGGTTVRLTSRPPGRRPRLMVGIAAATIGALGIAGLVAVERDDPVPPAAGIAPTSPPFTAWQPSGEEFPIVDLGPATESQGGPVVEALTRRIRVPGSAERVVAPSLTYHGASTAEIEQCVWVEPNGGGGCRPEWNPLTWSFSDDADADAGVFTLEGLPLATAFVTYTDGVTQFWQRPVFGFAAFPNLPGTDEVVTAWDAAGTPIGSYGSAAYLGPQSGVTMPPMEVTGQGVVQQLFSLTRSSMAACLTAAGGIVSEGDVAAFPDDVDQVAVWDDCVVDVKAIVGQRVAELT